MKPSKYPSTYSPLSSSLPTTDSLPPPRRQMSMCCTVSAKSPPRRQMSTCCPVSGKSSPRMTIFLWITPDIPRKTNNMVSSCSASSQFYHRLIKTFMDSLKAPMVAEKGTTFPYNVKSLDHLAHSCLSTHLDTAGVHLEVGSVSPDSYLTSPGRIQHRIDSQLSLCPVSPAYTPCDTGLSGLENYTIVHLDYISPCSHSPLHHP